MINLLTPEAFLGWFDKPDQTEPAHDPGDGVPCPICGEPIADRKAAKNTSIMPADRRVRCYFYYMHPHCAEDHAAREAVEYGIMNWIDAHDAH